MKAITKRQKGKRLLTACLPSLLTSPYPAFSVIYEDTLLRAMQLGHPKKSAGQTAVICTTH